ncbi:nucleoside deaminase [Paenibacillus puerhi]|uniref:nucleoside deaminase n=1 Tax=Paenibacillus puerhi TaxID=2692622 RepID=UPI00135780FA|nr:nucleoside deaminase [Paenibacillus puerhi]
MNHEQFMDVAIQMAYDNVNSGHGGPFGAIVVKDGQIIGRGCNEVTSSLDPTAHAEVQAIRAACKHLNSFQLEGCVVYTSCEPCPMCIGAIFWARPDAVYYACTKQEAADIGFDDQFIYDQIALPMDRRSIVMKQVYPPDSPLPFRAWSASEQKVEY